MKIIILFFLFLVPAAWADIQINVTDGVSEGFNDPTPVSSIGGNTGTTLGQQRLNVFREAARILESQLNIRQPVVIQAQFDPLECSYNSAILGQAGAADYETTAFNTEITPHALQNQISGHDIDTSRPEIYAYFNSSIDNNDNCLANKNWYYGFDNNSGNDTSLLSTVIHEIMHGLGFSSTIQEDGEMGIYTDGYLFGTLTPLYDPFTLNLYSTYHNSDIKSLSSDYRSSVLRSLDKLVWAGPLANSAASQQSEGMTDEMIQMYAPNPYEPGSSVSHFNTALTPDELMEPINTGTEIKFSLSVAALQDIGWEAYEPEYPPVITEISNKFMNEDTTLSFIFSSYDRNGDSLSFSLTGDVEAIGASISGKSIFIQPPLNYNGLGRLTLTANDGRLTSSVSFSITINAVNDAPIINNDFLIRTMEEVDTILLIDADDVDNDTLTYSIEGLNPSINYSITEREVRFSPAKDLSGKFPFQLNASDGVTTIKKNMILEITNINDAPSLTVIDVSTPEDIPWVGDLAITDPDNTNLNIQLNSDTPETQLALEDSILTVTTPEHFNGEVNITISVSDGEYTRFGNFTLTVIPVNDVPTIQSISNRSMTSKETLIIPVIINDADNDSLTLEIKEQPQNLNAVIIDGNLVITKPTQFIGSANLTLEVSDGTSSVTTSFILEIELNNEAPVLPPIPAQQTDEDTSLSFILNASDTDGDDIIYTANTSVDWLQVSIEGDILTLTPNKDESGTVDITVTISDGVLQDSKSFTLIISAVNDAPVFLGASTMTFTEDSKAKLLLQATDVDSTNLIYSIVSAPIELGARINGGYLEITPNENYFGEDEVIVKVSDSLLSTTKKFNVEITPINDRPALEAITDATLSAGSNGIYQLNLTDIENDAEVSVSSSNSALVAASIVNGQLFLNAPTDYNGKVRITITVTDEEYTLTRSFWVTIENGLPQPELTLYVNGEEISNDGSNPTFSQVDLRDVLIYAYKKVDEWSFSIEYEGVSRDDLLIADNAIFHLKASTRGAFAGEYQFTARSNTDTVPPLQFKVFHPPVFTSNAEKFLNGINGGRLTIQGLPAGTLVSAESSDDSVSLFNPINETAVFIAPDSEETNNALTFGLSSIAESFKSSEITLTPAGAGFSPIEFTAYFMTADMHTFAVTNESGDNISGAEVRVTNKGREAWGLPEIQLTDISGQTSVMVPSMHLGYSVTANGYYIHRGNIATWVNDITKVVLKTKPENYRINGQISASGFTFEKEAPLIEIILEDGSSVIPELTAIGNDIIAYNWTWDWESSPPEKLVITHSLSDRIPVRRTLTPENGEELIDISLNAIEINIEQNQPVNESVKPSESPEAPKDNSSSGGGNAAWLLITAIALLRRKRLKVKRA